ncbi:Endonuclease/exonuclease/phosphatase [Catenaria anguillulae PL171]|uniref:DNA-(apurinic or apyrimidinic site) endonuclease n=1 Tax=Catenaria anguillulae PL171 TaxID=765915 RepID=A0A1Y2HVJ0_9FUNG|nr:Endonuclease/exonuclease/phosphatase [Catenaria anguillulae PL171]
MPPKRKASARLAAAASQDSHPTSDSQSSTVTDSQASTATSLDADDNNNLGATPPKPKHTRKRLTDPSTSQPPTLADDPADDSQATTTAQFDSQLSDYHGTDGSSQASTFDSQLSSTAGVLAHIPTNTTLPADIEPTPVPDGHVKIVTLNVGGFNAAMKKGLDKYMAAEAADIVCLQEVKLNSDPDPDTVASLADYPHRYFHHCTAKRGYAGTAVLSKVEPISSTLGLPDGSDNEGRVITLEFNTWYLVATYVMNAGQGLKRLDEKMQWNAKLRTYVKELDQCKPVVWCGDLNVAHCEGDLARPKTNAKTAGFTPTERADFSSTLASVNLRDVWRDQHPDPCQQFTYFSYRFQCRAKRIGWRLDYFVVSARLLEGSEADVDVDVDLGQCTIRDDMYGMSDHVPVVLTLRAGSQDDADGKREEA